MAIMMCIQVAPSIDNNVPLIDITSNVDVGPIKRGRKARKGRGRPETSLLSKEEQRKAAILKYQSKNPDIVKAAIKKYQSKNPDIVKAAIKKYQSKNQDIVKVASV